MSQLRVFVSRGRVSEQAIGHVTAGIFLRIKMAFVRSQTALGIRNHPTVDDLLETKTFLAVLTV